MYSDLGGMDFHNSLFCRAYESEAELEWYHRWTKGLRSPALCRARHELPYLRPLIALTPSRPIFPAAMRSCAWGGKNLEAAFILSP